MQITTLPVYSKLADTDALPPELAAHLPAGWRLSAHQLATYQALHDPNVDVVINTAMTGDGKSLAAYLATLLDPDRGAFGMYPTNELARDQQRQFAGYAQSFDISISFDSLWGGKLGRLVAEHPEFVRRAEALAAILRDKQVLLTNPDILHLMVNFRYTSQVLSAQELIARLSGLYRDFIFDEFHLFSTPQMVSAITAMLLFSEITDPDRRDRPRFLFSSATPRLVFAKLLENSGLRVTRIAGTYRAASEEGFRQVLHGAELSLHRLDAYPNTEAWLANNLDVIRDHWANAAEQQPRAVVIVNSVVEARRIARLLRDRLPTLKIGENTGLTDDERRADAMATADLIVGTSTIDVGVDFNISLLIFEAPDAGAFLQRFGRLGRVRRDGSSFHRYEAHALFSGKTPWILDGLIKELADRGVHDGDVVERPTTLRDAVVAAFPTTNDFERYTRRWGALQAAHIVAALEDRQLGGSFAETAVRLRMRYQQALAMKDFNSAVRRYWYLRRGANDEGSTACRTILDEVLTFRGSSPFQVGLWDDSVTPAAFLSYDAFVIAQSSEIQIADPQSVRAALMTRYPQPADRDEILGRWAYVVQQGTDPVVLHVDAFFDERERLILQIDKFNPKTQTNSVLLLKTLSIKAPRGGDLARLNAILRRQPVVAYIIRRDAADVRRMLRLPPFFPLYQLEDSHDRSYTLALGQAALLLEAEAFKLRDRDEEQEPIIC